MRKYIFSTFEKTSNIVKMRPKKSRISYFEVPIKSLNLIFLYYFLKKNLVIFPVSRGKWVFPQCSVKRYLKVLSEGLNIFKIKKFKYFCFGVSKEKFLQLRSIFAAGDWSSERWTHKHQKMFKKNQEILILSYLAES